ncbi:MAG TPA: serine hydrolase [Xanthobacteraceae bacterium]|nr:serine hydrolase [Xanthobacteraceae bacterium]
MTRCAKIAIVAALFGITSVGATMPAAADAQLLIEAESGKVLHEENATYPWYPASLTKLMTLYVALQAMRDRRVTADTMITVSARAAAEPPAKMGFKAGSQLTLDNALKMMMVRSANDVAVTIAEGISGSVEKFSDEMNSAAHRLGMVQSSFVNPNGLPADNQISSARDLGILARALIRDFPQYGFYWHIPAIRFGKRVTRNYNRLISRYPGADGMKTGYICASGFNLVASATRNGKQLIAVVLGAPTSTLRAEKAAQLLERGFNGNGLSWLRPSLGTVDALTPIAAAPPNLREDMCGPNRKKPASETEDEDDAEVVAQHDNGEAGSAFSLRPPKFSLAALPVLAAEPIDVFVGAPKQAARVASGAAPGAKPIPVTPVQSASAGKQADARAGTAPATWTTLTPTPLAHAPPPAMSTALSETPATVPLPRPRPVIKPKPQAVKPAAQPPA